MTNHTKMNLWVTVNILNCFIYDVDVFYEYLRRVLTAFKIFSRVEIQEKIQVCSA